MKSLPLEKVWTGDGYGQAEAVVLTQVKRTETVALYKRTKQKTGNFEGYEVFIIKMRHKGDQLPGGIVEEEDREVYPSAGSFGRTAWHIWNKPYAEERYDELVKKGDPEAESEEKKEITIPVGEFVVNDVVELNCIPYPIASIFVKQSVENGSVKFLRQERRNAKGKLSNVFQKVEAVIS